MSELPHPLVEKAAEAFGNNPEEDNFDGQILGFSKLGLKEVKISQWRGGVWLDPTTEVNWLVVGGLAKGEHQDHDDFYQQIARTSNCESWLPTRDDIRLLKRETASRMLSCWEMTIQQQLLEALQVVHVGGETRLVVPHPHQDQGQLAGVKITLTKIREPQYQADEVLVEVEINNKFKGSKLATALTLRILTVICPPEQEWDRYKNAYSNIAEPGYFLSRIRDVEEQVSRGIIVDSAPGDHAHYTHRRALTEHVVEGKAVKSLCGRYFVPCQDHERRPRCTRCEELYEDLPV